MLPKLLHFFMLLMSFYKIEGNSIPNQDLTLSDIQIESEESNNFLNPELPGNPRLILMDDYGEVRRNFFETVRENSRDPDEFLENYEKFKEVGGVFGDPHFVIPISEHLNICFNWVVNSSKPEFFNLLWKNDHFINVKMESKHDVTTHYNVTNNHDITGNADVTNHAFITQLSIYIPKIHTQVHFYPRRVTVKAKDSLFHIEMKKGSSYLDKNIFIEVDRFTIGSRFISVKILNEFYRIVLRSNTEDPHINFYFANISTNRNIEGIVGHFYKQKVTYNHLTKDKVLLNIGNSKIKAHRHIMHNKMDKLPNHCWLLSHNSTDVLKHGKYKINTISSKPSFNL